MTCFDCGNPAVAVCIHCGAGICRDHTMATTVHLTRTMAINRIVAVEPPARQLRCTTCHTASLAATT